MKKVAMVGGVCALLLLVPFVVLAATGSGMSALDEQQFRYRDTATTTSRASWRNVPGLTPVTACSLGQVTFTMSARLSGAPVVFRVRVDGVNDPTAFAHPGAIRLDPRSGGEVVSFTFVRSVAPFEGNDNHSFELQWRSPTGDPTTMHKGVVTALYERPPACDLPT